MKGSYGLVLRRPEAGELAVGRLGRFHFATGYYLYFGNAFNGLEARVGRHLRRDKRPHWHIDFITKVMPVQQVWWTAGPQPRECAWTQLALEHSEAVVPAPGFGSSDCRVCSSHLVYLLDPGAVAEIADRLGGLGEHPFHRLGNINEGESGVARPAGLWENFFP